MENVLKTKCIRLQPISPKREQGNMLSLTCYPLNKREQGNAALLSCPTLKTADNWIMVKWNVKKGIAASFGFMFQPLKG
jgi:hypothetical protein